MYKCKLFSNGGLEKIRRQALPTQTPDNLPKTRLAMILTVANAC